MSTTSDDEENIVSDGNESNEEQSVKDESENQDQGNSETDNDECNKEQNNKSLTWKDLVRITYDRYKLHCSNKRNLCHLRA